VANLSLCRSDRASAFSFSLRQNPWILRGMGFELALLLGIVYTPWGRAIFGTTPISAGVWLILLPFLAAMLAIEEARKWIVWRWWRGSLGPVSEVR
jgi:hypothetical protein